MIGNPQPFPIGSGSVDLVPIDIRAAYPREMVSADRTLFVETIARNALIVAKSADSETIAAGLGWYRLARRECRTIAKEHGITVRAAAGIVSALSPRTEWFENLRRARIVAETGEPIGMNPHGTRAAAIANGSKPLQTLGGFKTRSFYRNILGDYEPATIDIWNLRVGIGNRSAGNREYHSLERVGMYGLVEQGFQLAAREFSRSARIRIATAELAAIDWLRIREPVP